VTEGKYIRFRAVTTDAAGNSTNGTESSSTLRDITLPTFSSSSNVGAASNGATDFIDITFGEPVYSDKRWHRVPDCFGLSALAVVRLEQMGQLPGNNCRKSGKPIVQLFCRNCLSGGETTVRVSVNVTGTRQNEVKLEPLLLLVQARL
jgi:hypothetical protein